MKGDLEETGYEGVDWILLAQVRAVEGSCEHGVETSVLIKWIHLDHLINY
jgi:hypothetical protein